ncbi:DUF1330 domain-containing protein [Thalassovita taeanensis]|uniref:Uncharacterized conserved protein, DUF1330 family n=1 Tax=Thalassovita taeanensis TaxID=657014 RepID=A0A1H9ILD4_9RHOB|nr:DUF1330 domain-containing protein [Thalassovita taeanensis]SEQ75551.1 Uncharacterized conserved protein, DUF1330 family [Thalassovita taeanensis]
MIYAYVHMHLTDMTALAAYREKAGAALAKHGGAVLSAAPQPTALEGKLPLPDMAVILSFPDKEHALAWIDDPELTAVHALRQAAGDVSVILIG